LKKTICRKTVERREIHDQDLALLVGTGPREWLTTEGSSRRSSDNPEAETGKA